MNLSTDREVMLAVRDGAINQLGILFEKYHQPLYNFFLKLTSQPPLSEDLVQEVFYRILKFRHTFRGEAEFKTWMFQIARNVRVDHYHQNRHRWDQLETAATISHPDPNPAENAEKENQREILHQALQKLSPEKREVLLLSRFQYLKYHEISKILNCKIGTVKAKVFRAMQELTQIYFELTGESK